MWERQADVPPSRVSEAHGGPILSHPAVDDHISQSFAGRLRPANAMPPTRSIYGITRWLRCPPPSASADCRIRDRGKLGVPFVGPLCRRQVGCPLCRLLPFVVPPPASADCRIRDRGKLGVPFVRSESHATVRLRENVTFPRAISKPSMSSYHGGLDVHQKSMTGWLQRQKTNA